LSELRTVIAVRAKETEERERCAILRQNPDYKCEEKEPAESAMSRTINNIGLAAEEWHIPVVNAECPANSCVASESDTGLQCSDQVTDETGAKHSSSNVTYNNDVPDINDTSCLYMKHIAQMAVAKSQQMVNMSEDAFEDDDFSVDSDS